MNELEEFKKIINNYGLDEKETYIDENKDSWFTQKFLKELMGTSISTISENIKEIFDWEILDEKTNLIYRNRSHSKSKIGFYSLDVLSQLGMTLKSNNARNFQKQLRRLFKGLVKGDLKLFDAKTLFNNISLIPTTPYREKINQRMLKKGLSEDYVETRCYNAKLNTELCEIIKELGYGNYNRQIQRKLAEAIYPEGINEFDALNNVNNPHVRRDYHEAYRMNRTQYLEKELIRKLVEHDGNINLRQLMKYVEDCVQIGMIIKECSEKNDEMIITFNNRQSSLDKYMIK